MASERLVHDGLQPCPYRPGQVARMPLRQQLRLLSLEETDERFARSERRVGTCLYRTECPSCRACEGLRVPVREFRPSRSQRRVAKRWEGHSRVDVVPPSWSEEHLRLYNRHKGERGLRGADDGEMTAASYVGWLVQSCSLTVEMRYHYDERLVGIGVVDLGRASASSVYFYFDPDLADLSPGTWSALQEIELCRRTGREFLYLGLWVEDCGHLSYKASFRPHERLRAGSWLRSDPGPAPGGGTPGD